MTGSWYDVHEQTGMPESCFAGFSQGMSAKGDVYFMEEKKIPVIRVKNLYKIYQVGTNKVYALNGVDFTMYRGEFCAIVGPSGSGKSTLLNRLTGAGILAEDKLFATLDPTTRALVLPGGEKVLLTDTVGFIRKLPHHLVEAFKSTLEEARYCDVILHVVDCSNPQMDIQMHVVYETLRRLDIKDKEIITVFNKVDRPDADTACRDMSADYKVRLSAKTGEGIGELLDLFAVILRNRRIYFEKVFAYKNAGRIQTIRKSGQLLSEEYQDDGIHVKAYVPVELFEELYRD